MTTPSLIERINAALEPSDAVHHTGALKQKPRLFRRGWDAVPVKRDIHDLSSEHGFDAKAHSKGGHVALMPKHVYLHIKPHLGNHSASEIGDHVRVRTPGPKVEEAAKLPRMRSADGKFRNYSHRGHIQVRINVSKKLREMASKLKATVKPQSTGAAVLVFEDHEKALAGRLELVREGFRVEIHDIPGVLFVSEQVRESLDETVVRHYAFRYPGRPFSSPADVVSKAHDEYRAHARALADKHNGSTGVMDNGDFVAHFDDHGSAKAFSQELAKHPHTHELWTPKIDRPEESTTRPARTIIQVPHHPQGLSHIENEMGKAMPLVDFHFAGNSEHDGKQYHNFAIGDRRLTNTAKGQLKAAGIEHRIVGESAPAAFRHSTGRLYSPEEKAQLQKFLAGKPKNHPAHKLMKAMMKDSGGVAKLTVHQRIGEALKDLANDDFQKRHAAGSYPKSNIPDQITVHGNHVVASFKNTREDTAKKWLHAHLTKHGHKIVSIDTAQTGDYADDWVDAHAEVHPKANEDALPGGVADGRADSDFDADELAMGVKVEAEHTSDPEKAREIAKDHLSEDPAYYSKLKKAGLADELGEAWAPGPNGMKRLTVSGLRPSSYVVSVRHNSADYDEAKGSAAHTLDGLATKHSVRRISGDDTATVRYHFHYPQDALAFSDAAKRVPGGHTVTRDYAESIVSRINAAIGENFNRVFSDSDDAEDVAKSRSIDDESGEAFYVISLGDGFMVLAEPEALERLESDDGASLHARFEDGFESDDLDDDDAEDDYRDADVNERHSVASRLSNNAARAGLKAGGMKRAKNNRLVKKARARRAAIYDAKRKARTNLHNKD